MASTITFETQPQSYANSVRSDSFEKSDATSDYEPMAVAVQPRRHFQNQVQLLESQARLTSIRSSTMSTAPSTLSQELGPVVPATSTNQLPFPELHLKASSILLGEDNAAKSQQGTSSQSKTLRGQESSSTLHSYYDPQKLPLVVSQQTSDSSSRDFALRQDNAKDVTPERRRRHFFDTSKSRAKSNEKKQRKERVDLSTLFPKPGTGARTETQQTSNPPYYKMHVKRPKAGTKHWFDNFDDELSDEENDFEPEMKEDFAQGLGEAFMSLSSDNSPACEDFPQNKTPPRSVPKMPETSKYSRILGIEAPLIPQRVHLEPPQPRHFPPNVPKSTIEKLTLPTPKPTPKSTPVNPLLTANLREESILFLSSDDEDDLSPLPAPTSRPDTQMTGGIRASLAISALDESDIEIGEATTVRSQPATVMHNAPSVDVAKPYSDPGRSANMKVLVPNRRSSRMASFLAEVSPQMQKSEEPQSGSSSGNSGSDAKALSHISQTNTAQPWAPHSSGEAEDASTQVTWEDAVGADPGVEKRVSTRLMPVTRQEQALLAAMRSKKATMQTRSFDEDDYQNWPDEHDQDSFYEHRQRMSTDTSAPAFVELGSNNYAEWASRRRSSLMANRYNETRESVTTFATASQRASTRLSYYPFDDTPNTPPSGRESALQRASTGQGTHFSMSSSEYHGHSRSRTDSSHIVVLDDLNDSPKGTDTGFSSPQFPPWAYKRWSDGAPGTSAATVH